MDAVTFFADLGMECPKDAVCVPTDSGFRIEIPDGSADDTFQQTFAEALQAKNAERQKAIEALLEIERQAAEKAQSEPVSEPASESPPSAPESP